MNSVPIRVLLLLMALISVTGMPAFNILMPVFAKALGNPAKDSQTLGLLMAASGAGALLCAIFKDKGFDAFAVVGALARTDSPQNPLTDQISKSATTTGAGSLDYVFGMIAVVALLWLAWALIFYRFAKTDDPNALVKRTMRWLLRGSILELLVAVPSHIIVRNRNDCCAPMGTFWGITTGLSIMLLCFGPGVFFLFVERCGRLRPAKPPTLQGD